MKKELIVYKVRKSGYGYCLMDLDDNFYFWITNSTKSKLAVVPEGDDYCFKVRAKLEVRRGRNVLTDLRVIS